MEKYNSETKQTKETRQNPIVEFCSNAYSKVVSKSKSIKDASLAITFLATFIGVASCVLIVLFALQPDLIFRDTTATGGDMGAHVWWPAYMRDVLLPSGRIFGWTMDFYSGFPVGQYYFPVPALMAVFLDIFLPYNIAFKIVTALGAITLPISAYVLGRCIRAPRPTPLLMSFAATAFLFFGGDPRANAAVDQSVSTMLNFKTAQFNHWIMGGPLLSNMAGEYSFTISLSFSLLFLGTFYVSVRDSKKRARVVVLFALTIMSHLVVAIFAGFAAIAFWGAVYVTRKGYIKIIGYSLLAWVVIMTLCIGVIGRYFFDNETSLALLIIFAVTAIVIGLVGYALATERRGDAITFFKDVSPLVLGLLISSVWLLPLFLRFGYTSNMRYEKLVDIPGTLANEVYELYLAPAYFFRPVFIPAAIGFVLSAALLRKSIVPLVITAGIMAVTFVQWPEGHAWNLRFLPFWYLFIFFVAAVGFGELFRLPSTLLARQAHKYKKRSLLKSAKGLSAGLTVLLVSIFFLGLVGSPFVEPASTDLIKDRRGLAPGWAKYNFEGYEGRKQAWPEFKALIDEMDSLEPGRALWETKEGSYGTTLALTLLPYFTDRKIASQEGLYYEASGSTAYHFLTVAEVSKQSSNPVRWPKCPLVDGVAQENENCFIQDYGTIADFDRGVEHMRMMGVRYFLAHSEESKAEASQHRDLELISTVADQDGQNPVGWQIFEIRDAELVVPLAHEPVIVTDKNDSKYWQQSGNKWLWEWWNSPGEFPVFVNEGPSQWERLTAKEALKSPLNPREQVKESDVKVSDVRLGDDKISFKVDKIGEPVLVRVSYYPTFKAKGASDVYRASPNFMVVVPSSNEVTIEIKRDFSEWLSYLLFIVGIGGCFYLIFLDKGRFWQASKKLVRKD